MKLKNLTIIACIVSSLFFIEIFPTRLQRHEPNQIKKGHLALPSSQQTGPLFAFGQNIIDKGDLQGFISANSTIGNSKNFTTVSPSLLYGITNQLSLLFELPIAARFKLCNNKSSGLGDMFLQLEYAVYDADTITYSNQITLVTAITLPTGKAFASPPTGVGSPSFFIGATASHMGTDWYVFTSQGGIITTERNNAKFGNSFLYQFGISKTIGDKSGWIFAAMLEWFGTYSQRAKIKERIDRNSGGNIFSVGPSLWASSERFVAQAGIAFVSTQNLFGRQPANRLIPAINIGWKF
ncbi:MAG: hypothetical protein NTX86_05445 [Candidatus Dependentiae bacterium]|nr:hypothetical protein [Candidatus Dependentiae bacterium]